MVSAFARSKAPIRNGSIVTIPCGPLVMLIGWYRLLRKIRMIPPHHAVPIEASANGSTSSTKAISAMPPHSAFGLSRVSTNSFMRGPRALSCAVPHPLAQQARRPEHQHRDQHQEREHVLVVAAEDAAGEVADVARAERLDQAEQHAAEHRAAEVADAAQH